MAKAVFKQYDAVMNRPEVMRLLPDRGSLGLALIVVAREIVTDMATSKPASP